VSFDSNADHRISRLELPERMQELVARADRNADAALDPSETRDLVNRASAGRGAVRFRPHASEGLPGVIKDLKLEPSKHAAALAIVRAHELSHQVNDPSGTDVHRAIRAVLDDEEYANFVAAATRLSRNSRIID
jgi:hypothetical protein